MSRSSSPNTDYYPGGMAQPGRTWIGGDEYRYSHNGHEREDEIFENAQSAEYWMYDSRILRRWEIDPITYEWQSPYAAFNNNPIYYADPLGLEGEDGNGEAGAASSPTKTPVGDALKLPEVNNNNNKMIPIIPDVLKLEMRSVSTSGASAMPDTPIGSNEIQPVPTFNNENTTPEGYTYMLPFTPYQPSYEMDTDGNLWRTEDQLVKNTWAGREYLRYAKFTHQLKLDFSLDAEKASLGFMSRDITLQAGPFSLSKNSGEFLAFGWSREVEKFAEITKPTSGPLASYITQTVLYDFVYEKN